MAHKVVETDPQQGEEKVSGLALAPVRVAVVTVSDARSPETDYAGRTVAYQISQRGHRVVRRWIVPDDPREIDEAVRDVAGDPDVDALILNGGTGLGRHEYVCEIVSRRLTKRLDGFAILYYGLAFQEVGTAALGARAMAGLVGQKVVIALPGNQTLCELAMERLVVPELPNLVRQAKK